MKKCILFYCVFLFSLAVRAGGFEMHYGIGIISVNPYNYFSISFWQSPKDKMPFDELYFQRDSGSPLLRCGFSTTGIDSIVPWFAPETFMIEDEKMRFSMRCIRKEENWCQVVVNNTTGEMKWIQLGMDIEFRNWEDFYKSVSGVEIISGKPILYEKPSAKSKFILIKSKQEAGMSQIIRTQKIQGNWMYVEVIERDESMKEIGKRSGWIQWRDADKPLIAYNIMGC